MRNLVIVAALALALAPRTASSAGMAIAELHNPKGELVGVATLTEGADGVTIAVAMHNMPPGTHALHIHAAGTCEGPHFTSAQGHFNPYNRKHGFKSPDGPHAGDLPNIVIGPDGVGAIVVTAPRVTLGPGENSLLREGGTAIMIHEGPDDHMTDPAGNAGGRIACGVIHPLS
jgi:Cu-Zn family superoxide dismutase